MSTVKVINVVHPSSATNNIVLDSSGNASVGGTMAMGSSFMRNRIINGAMVIDQRNAGAAVTQGTSNLYGVDRFQSVGSVTSKFTFQQSSTAPAGFINSTVITSSAATTLAATDFYMFGQLIEGLNISDLAWGTANAKTVTLSFWVQSSLTGTFGGSIQNSDNSRNYPFTYTISSTNTWEQKSVTITGDTSGTWLTTNGVGMKVRWSMGAGTTVSGTAGAWSGTLYYSATGATSVVGTNGATFYITGVQLEVGSVATPFERRQYGQELALCERYYQTASSVLFGGLYQPSGTPGTIRSGAVYYPVTMRVAPTVTFSGQSYGSCSGLTVDSNQIWGFTTYVSTSGATGFSVAFSYTSSAEL